ncbi:isochorismatase family protein [Candidatus Wolfebacteria bacterium]|nr:isochorismatase family protein [Candidatus Wolfebacteria bacterium]
MKNSFVVVIVDMQDEFLIHISDKEERNLIRNQIEIIEYCAKKDIPIITLEYHGFGETTNALKRKLKKVSRVKIVVKFSDNGFVETELENYLRQWNAKTILLTGIFANRCVRSTGQGALGKGFKIATANSLLCELRGDFKDMWWFNRVGLFGPDISSILSLLCEGAV